jgi:diguanylate cyclase (GGDEF)-like protein/PAS domain S-box-containing protein
MAHDPTKARKGSDEANHYAARLLQHLVVPTFVIDADRRVVVWNRACERLTGVPALEVLGTRNHWQAFYEDNRYCLADLVALGRQNLIGQLYSEFVVTQDDRLGSSAENWCMMPRLGNHLYLAIDAGPIHDDEGNLIAVVETLRDMTEQKRAELALRTLAAKDALTGLANRRSFDQAIEMEWARAERSGRPLALLFADVDHFKLFNDKHGHQSGDECLRAVAAIVGAQALRPVDLAARYGGEEFAIILPQTRLKDAKGLADQIRRTIMSRRVVRKNSGDDYGTITMSIGVACYRPGEQLLETVRRADAALYQAKRNGRNRVVTEDALEPAGAGVS